MGSFSKMGAFPAGYFRATAEWLLRERRDVMARVSTMQAELARIGEVRMVYRRLAEGDGTRVSEQRQGFAVTKGSSIARLMQAYIAQGGNPYNISSFLYPDTTAWVMGADGLMVRVEAYPGGGFVAPKSVSYIGQPSPLSEDGSVPPEKTGYEAHEGGMIASHKYLPGRMGGRLNRGSWDYSTVNRLMHDVRKWANKEIKTRLQDMEWRIVKLSDLAEQLTKERDEVLQEAFAGQLSGLPPLDEDQQDPRRLCQCLIQDMYALLYETNGDVPFGFRANAETGFLGFTFPDVPEDEAGTLG